MANAENHSEQKAKYNSTSSTVQIDALLWNRLLDAKDQQDLAESWLVLLCRQIEGAKQGVLILRQENGSFSPAATFPNDKQYSPEKLSIAAEKALSGGKGIAYRPPDAPSIIHIAWPTQFGEGVGGAIVVAVDHDVDQRLVLRQLQWAAGWVEALWHRRQHKAGEHAIIASRIISSFLKNDFSITALTPVLAYLSDEVGAMRVTLGLAHKDMIRLAGVSGTSHVEPKSQLGSALQVAMQDSFDQGTVLVYPPLPDGGYGILNGLKSLTDLSHGQASMAIPFANGFRGDGVILFEFSDKDSINVEFSQEIIQITSFVGPVLSERFHGDPSPLKLIASALRSIFMRPFTPQNPAEKVAITGAVLAFCSLSLWPVDFNVSASASIEGAIQRHIVAAQDGIIAEATVRAGEAVKKDQLLARLDDRELILEKLSSQMRRRQLMAEEVRSRAEKNQAQVRIIQAQIDQVDSDIALLKARHEMVKFVAPFDGMVIEGDLTQRIGAAVSRGDTLFIIAPLNEFRVLLKVDEEDIGFVEVNQTGHILVPSRPNDPVSYKIERVTPVAVAADGRNAFHVEAQVQDTPSWLRPGMRGIAKTLSGQKPLLWIWGHRMVTWTRLQIWKLSGI